MSDYRRMFVFGGRFFLTLVTERRRPLLATSANIALLRQSIVAVRAARPFELLAAVVLPDHLHLLMELPAGDADSSTRIGMIKALFTKMLPMAERPDEPARPSRKRRRERMVWQRRFWEHAIRDEQDLEAHMDYIHYNPVKHGVVSCPHAWPYSSFHRWVAAGRYRLEWACACNGAASPPAFERISESAGE